MLARLQNSASVSPMPSPISDQVEIRFSEVIAALSYALDITEGQPQGHAARTCLLGMRIARELRLDLSRSSALFYALLLKDLGCSSNASKVCYLFGTDDRDFKQGLKTVDWTSFIPKFRYAAGAVLPGGSAWGRVARLFRVAVAGEKGAKELIQLRCERGASIARQLQLPDATAAAIRSLDEHWDGSGHPEGLTRDSIPLLSRILGLAQTVEVFVSNFGVDAAYDMAVARSGTWFDPALVKIFLSLRHDGSFWETFRDKDPKHAVAKVEPMEQTFTADPAALDRIALGFAQVIDAKSPWTFRHSEGVSEIAAGLAETIGLDPATTQIIRRAGLLHDIGKLTPEEMTEMRKHPAYTYQLLDAVAGFRGLASLAASHHERLDGKGYHRGLAAPQLSVPDRILCVADMYEALAAKRPYRQDLSPEEVMNILTRNAGAGICPAVFDTLKTYINASGDRPIALAA